MIRDPAHRRPPHRCAFTLAAEPEAIQYGPEGTTLGTKFDPEKQPPTPELKKKGLSADQYVKPPSAVI
eukprot:3355952-Prymnesium_polylepis.1